MVKVSAAWVSIVWVVCFALVGAMPGLRPGFMMYGMHTSGINLVNVLTVGTFISGLIIWNIVVSLAVGLFGYLYNTIKK